MPARTPRFVTYIIWLLLAVLAIGQPGAKGPTMAPAEILGAHANAESRDLQGKLYVALGDSISAGRYATAPEDVFPSLVADKLGMRLHLVAHSGAKAAWALPQLGSIAASRPALVTVELGTNDVGFNTPPAVFAAEYETIVTALAGPQTQVLCLGSWLPSAGFDVIIADACQRHGGTYVSLDGFYKVNEFHAADGGSSYLGRADWFHPGDQGHAAMAAAVLAALGRGPTPVVAAITPAPSASGILRTHPK